MAHEEVTLVELKPALMTIPNACLYLGGISNSTFYASILPQLEVVNIGGRTMIPRMSLDKFIASRTRLYSPRESNVLKSAKGKSEIVLEDADLDML